MKRTLLFLSQLFVIASFGQATNNELKGKRLTLNNKSVTAISNDTAIVNAADSNKLATLYASKKYTNNAVIGVSVKMFGAVGDGVTDDQNEIQAAIDFVSNKGGGMVLLPEGNYRVDTALYLKSNVILKGINGKSRIFNDKATNVKSGDQSVIFMGNYAPISYNNTRKYNAADIPSGSNYAKLTTPANIDSFSVGMIVLVESGLSSKRQKSYSIPRYSFINRVTAINGDTLFFQDPVSDTIVNAKIGTAGRFTVSQGATDPFGIASYICYNAGIEDLTLESVYGSWNNKNGSFYCYFKNITTIGLNGIYGNGFSHFNANNVTSYFTNKGIEMAMYSHDAYVDGFQGFYTDKYLTVDNEGDVDRSVIKFGENSRNINLTNCFINAAKKSGESLVLFGASYKNSMSNSTLYADSMSIAAVEFRTSTDTSECMNNVVSDCVFKTYNTNRFVKLFIDATADTLANLKGNTVNNSAFYGTISAGGLAVYFSGEENFINGCKFNQGSIDAASARSSNNVLSNTYIPDEPYKRLKGVTTSNNFTQLTAVDNGGADTTNLWRGYKAADSLSSGLANTAIGKRSLNKLGGGNNNTAIGSGSLENIVTADNNTASGKDALKYNLSGNANTAAGTEALYNNVSGSSTAFGYRALYNSLNNFNSAFGREAGTGSSAGTYSDNSLFGYKSGFSLSTGSFNVFAGSLSGQNGNGNGNTYLGYNTGVNSVSGANNILIGRNVSLPKYNATGYLSIGNILFGRGMIANPDSTAQAGFIGIDIKEPTDFLHLPGSTVNTSALRFAGGVSPTGANLRDGQFWFDSTLNHFFTRLNGVTYQLDQPTVVGTITTGTWNAGLIASLFGGTGIANAGTLSYGANNLSFTTSGATALTLPTAGTMATLAGTESFANKTFTNDILLTSGVNIGSAAAPAGTIRAQTLRSGTGQNLNITANASGNTITFNQSTTEIARFANTSGNFLLNTTTDNGYKLDVNGNSNFAGSLTTTERFNLLATANASARFYNTADTTTNYERAMFSWGSNVFTIGTESAGTGQARALNLNGKSSLTLSQGGGVKLTISAAATTGFVNMSGSNLSTSNASIGGVTGSLTHSSGLGRGLSLLPTINQSSTGGYQMLWISPYEQTTGTGSKLLIDAGNNSAANGGGTHTSRFSVDNAGNTITVGTMKIGAYTLPATDGTSGQVLKTNGSGVLTWSADNNSGGGGGYPKAVQNLTDGATITMDITSGNHGRVTLGGNRTLSMTNLADGDEGWIVVKQDGTGSRTLTLPSTSTVPNGFGGGTSIDLSTGAGQTDVLYFVVDGTTIHWSISKTQIAAS